MQISQILKSSDPRKFSIRSLRKALVDESGGRYIPSYATLRLIVREKFSLRYQRLNLACFKYADPSFDEKRLWVSRLLAQFFYENVFIVSIDESCFKTIDPPKR